MCEQLILKNNKLINIVVFINLLICSESKEKETLSTTDNNYTTNDNIENIIFSSDEMVESIQIEDSTV